MKHLNLIRSYLKTLCASDSLHVLVLLSPPGWAKSSTLDSALRDLKLKTVSVGAYATPLHLFNTIAENPSSLIILDDTASIFDDAKTMSILKAAAWPASGTGGERRVNWGSTSEKVSQASCVFRGKLILIANSIPDSREAQAFLSRAIFYEMKFDREEMAAMLKVASKSKAHFQNTTVAKEVASFLIEQIQTRDCSSISLRTLQIGCELAATHPKEWRDLLLPLLPPPSRGDMMQEIVDSSLSPRQQEHKFISETGLSRRTFYNEKKRLGLSRPYHRSSRRAGRKATPAPESRG